MAFKLACPNLIEKLLVTAAVGNRHVHVFSNFFKLVLEVNRLKFTVAEYDLVKFLFVYRPYLLKALFEMVLELLVYFSAPRIFGIVFKRFK